MRENDGHIAQRHACINVCVFVDCSVPPLFVIEFLHRIVDIFAEYFTECNEQTIKDHYVIVYEVKHMKI